MLRAEPSRAFQINSLSTEFSWPAWAEPTSSKTPCGKAEPTDKKPAHPGLIFTGWMRSGLAAVRVTCSQPCAVWKDLRHKILQTYQPWEARGLSRHSTGLPGDVWKGSENTSHHLSWRAARHHILGSGKLKLRKNKEPPGRYPATSSHLLDRQWHSGQTGEPGISCTTFSCLLHRAILSILRVEFDQNASNKCWQMVHLSWKHQSLGGMT